MKRPSITDPHLDPDLPVFDVEYVKDLWGVTDRWIGRNVASWPHSRMGVKRLFSRNDLIQIGRAHRRGARSAEPDAPSPMFQGQKTRRSA